MSELSNCSLLKVYPTLSLFVNNVPITEQETIEILYNQSYTLACSSVGSKPDVSLSLFDTMTNVSLSNGQNNITTGSCDPNTLLCNQILQIVFSYDNTNNVFDQMTSLTCLAESKQPQLYPLRQSISRSVNVVLPPSTTSSPETSAASSSISESSMTSQIVSSSTTQPLTYSTTFSASESTAMLSSTHLLSSTAFTTSSTELLTSTDSRPSK